MKKTYERPTVDFVVYEVWTGDVSDDYTHEIDITLPSDGTWKDVD